MNVLFIHQELKQENYQLEIGLREIHGAVKSGEEFILIFYSTY